VWFSAARFRQRQCDRFIANAIGNEDDAVDVTRTMRRTTG